MPQVSCSTFATGARPLVVQEALEMTWCFFGSYISLLTPSTIVRSSFLAGAEITTFFTVPRLWATALVASVKKPVLSTTTCTPWLDQSMAPGSFSAKTLICLPSTTRSLPS